MVFTKDEYRGEKGHRQTIIITYNLSRRIIIPIKSFYGTEVESKNNQNKKKNTSPYTCWLIKYIFDI